MFGNLALIEHKKCFERIFAGHVRHLSGSIGGWIFKVEWRVIEEGQFVLGLAKPFSGAVLDMPARLG